MLAGGRSFFPSTKALRLPITKDILTALTVTPPNNITWMPLLKLHGPVLCAWENPLIRLLKRAMRLLLRLTDVTFSEQDQYATLRLKRSKTDVNHAGVLIMIAATNHSTCPVTALCKLFTHDPRPAHAPLFAFNNYSFSHQDVVGRLGARLFTIGVSNVGFSGYSF